MARKKVAVSRSVAVNVASGVASSGASRTFAHRICRVGLAPPPLVPLEHGMPRPHRPRATSHIQFVPLLPFAYALRYIQTGGATPMADTSRDQFVLIKIEGMHCHRCEQSIKK